MTDKLTPSQTLLVWGLLAKQGVAKQADIVPEPKAADRKVLEAAKLVSVAKISRSIWLKLEDRGWGWAGDHLRDPLPPAQLTLQDMMARLHEHIAKTGATLADVISAPPESLPGSQKAGGRRPPSSKPKTEAKTKTKPRTKTKPFKGAGVKTAPVSAREEIERAYLAVTGNRNGVEARLSEVRSHLVHLDRVVVDKALASIRRGDEKARLMRIDDQRSITPADQAAALSFAGESLHILWIMK